MKQLFLLFFLLPVAAVAQYSYGEKISIRSGGVLNENANGSSYNVAAAGVLVYVGSEEYFGARGDIVPTTARINYRIRESSNPGSGTDTQLPVSTLTTSGDVWFYRGAAGNGCNCPINIDLYDAAPGNGTFTLEAYISVQRTDGSTFSGGTPSIVFTVTGKAPQPVSLVSFTVQKENAIVALSWTTATEQNNSYFEVERSRDLLTWQRVTTTEGSGTTSTARTYTAQDLSPLRGTSYYRLKQVDSDGKATFFRPQSVTIDVNPSITLLPTITDRDLTISGIDGDVQLSIYDLKGALQQRHSLQTTTILDVSALRSGLYIVRTTDATSTRSQRILIQH
ncbi:T9SS type A sorting domain-containing protein [Fibrella arboris]|uniref:T9SS type A sorting domain-containing protein n=1 Tax=Fibrella arboris TaxID=3242486 RepID=UPI00351FFF06